MLGKRSAHLGLPEADNLYIDHVGRGSFYGFPALMRGQLFKDEDFAGLYCPDNGRDSVPPSLLGTALLQQTYDRRNRRRGCRPVFARNRHLLVRRALVSIAQCHPEVGWSKALALHKHRGPEHPPRHPEEQHTGHYDSSQGSSDHCPGHLSACADSRQYPGRCGEGDVRKQAGN